MDIKDLNIDQFTSLVADKVTTKLQSKFQEQMPGWLHQSQQQQQQGTPNGYTPTPGSTR